MPRYKNLKNYKQMTKEQLIKEVEYEYDNYIKMDRLADKRAQEIADLKATIDELQKTLKTTDRNLQRSLGYIDRIKDEERDVEIKTVATLPTSEEVTHEPRGPRLERLGPLEKPYFKPFT